MPAPENTGNLTQEEYEKLWGPEEVEGFSRDEIYDSMRANGWNREGDDQIIAALYKIAALCAEGAIYQLPNASGTTDEDRYDFFNDMLDEAKAIADKNAVAEELEMIRGLTVPPEELQRRAEEQRREEELQRTRAEAAAYENEYQIRRAAEERLRQEREASRHERELDDLESAMDELQRVEQEELDRPERERRAAEERARLEEESRRAEEEARVRSEALEREQEQQEREEREQQIREQSEATIREEMRRNELMREGRENLRRDEEFNIARTADIRELLKEAVDLGLDRVNLNGVEVNWATGIDTNLSPEEQKRQEDELLKDNPVLRQKITNMNDTQQLLTAIVQTLRQPQNREFAEACRRGVTYVTAPLNDVTRLERYINCDAYTKERQHDTVRKLGTMQLNNMGDLLTQENMKDDFWTFQNDDGPMTDEQVAEIKKRFQELNDAGVPFDEFMASPPYREMLEKEGTSWSSLGAVSKLASDPESEQYVRSLFGKKDGEYMLKAMDSAEKLYKDKGLDMCNTNAEGIAHWLPEMGYDLMENSIAFGGFEASAENGSPLLKIGMVDDIESRLDRDILSDKSYTETLNNVKAAQEFYIRNKDFLEHAFGTMHLYTGGTNIGVLLQDADRQMTALDKNPESMKKLNNFRHLLFKARQSYDTRNAKLINKDKQTVIVEPLEAETDFTQKKVVDKETEVLGTCYDMLHEAGSHVTRNSAEYKKIQSSLLNIQKVLNKQYENPEEARKAYVKAVNKTLNNINAYRMHKAVDGIKEDGTRDKLIAVERVDKLLRTRYQSIEQRDYEDQIGGLAELFKVDVPEGTVGDAYVLQKARNKIANMKKVFEDYNREIAEGNVKRSKSFTGIHDMLEYDEGVIRRSNSLGGTPQKEVKKENVKEAVAEPPVSRKAHEITRPAQKKEEAYRKTLDPQDEYGQEKLVSSAEKSLLLESLAVKAKQNAENKVEEELTLKGSVRDYEKNSSIRYRVFKFERLTDKDFNKEFKQNVLEGAKNGKVSEKDIREFRDDALRKCYTQYQGKDTRQLDALSEALGSKVNSRSIAKELKDLQKQQNQGPEGPKL